MWPRRKPACPRSLKRFAPSQPHRLASRVRDLIEKNDYAVSVASYWELINKKERRDAPVNNVSAVLPEGSSAHPKKKPGNPLRATRA